VTKAITENLEVNIALRLQQPHITNPSHLITAHKPGIGVGCCKIALSLCIVGTRRQQSSQTSIVTSRCITFQCDVGCDAILRDRNAASSSSVGGYRQHVRLPRGYSQSHAAQELISNHLAVILATMRHRRKPLTVPASLPWRSGSKCGG
jgi:hypothetical protein